MITSENMKTLVLKNQLIIKDIVCMALLLGFLFGINLGARLLSTPDEGRYAEIPREMAAQNDYITPRLNAIKYFEKPPLMYWLGSVSIKLFGLQEWALRFWPALFMLLTCLMVYWAGFQLYNRITGQLAALTLASSLLGYSHSQLLILDPGVTFFITTSLLGFFLASNSTRKKEQNIYLILFYASMALGTLTKGLIGSVIPGMIILLYSAITKNKTTLGLAFKPWGLLLYLLISVPWHILVTLKNPEFPEFYFIHEHFSRYTTTVHHRKQFFGFFILVSLLGWFPWVGFLITALKNSLKGKTSWFLVIWAGSILVFFSLSDSQLIPYILPVFPALSLILGNWLSQNLDSEKTLNLKIGVFTYVITSFLFSIITPFTVSYRHIILSSHSIILLVISLSMLLLGSMMSYYFFLKHRPRAILSSIMISTALFFVLFLRIWPFIENRSIKTLAENIREHIQPGDEIISYQNYYQDLPFYVNQRVIVVESIGELEFGTQHEDTSSWMFNQKAFEDLWNSNKKAYLVTSKGNFENLSRNKNLKFYKLSETNSDILIVNKDSVP